jgi:hypothetical protein
VLVLHFNSPFPFALLSFANFEIDESIQWQC